MQSRRTYRRRRSKRPNPTDRSQPTSEELLLRELSRYPKKKLDKDDVYRVAQMVQEYQGRIKAYLHEQQEKKTSRLDRFADRLATFGGSWWFVVTLTATVTIWLLLNHSKGSLFMLSFSLSVFTAFQAAFIQMSQNRQSAKDKQEQMLDNAINYKAEKENREIQYFLKQIDERLASLQTGVNGEQEEEETAEKKTP